MVERGRLQLLPHPKRGLRVPLGKPAGRRRYEGRTPTMAAGLTDFIWTVADVLCTPVYPARGPG